MTAAVNELPLSLRECAPQPRAEVTGVEVTWNTTKAHCPLTLATWTWLCHHSSRMGPGPFPSVTF